MSELRDHLGVLRDYALANPLDVLKMERPHQYHYRDFSVRGKRYRICFTYQVSGDIRGFILSVYNLDQPGDMPDEVVCRHVADIIFPDGVYMDGDALNINVLQVSRKFISFEKIKKEET